MFRPGAAQTDPPQPRDKSHLPKQLVFESLCGPPSFPGVASPGIDPILPVTAFVVCSVINTAIYWERRIVRLFANHPVPSAITNKSREAGACWQDALARRPERALIGRRC